MADLQLSNKHRLDLPMLLPDVPDVRDDCVQRLMSSLQSRAGIEQVHVVEATNGTPAKLCIHYDPEAVPLPRIRQIAKSLGAELTDHFGHLVWLVKGIRHARMARTVAHRLREKEGILEADVSASGRVRIEYDRSETNEEEIRGVLHLMSLRVVEQRLHEQKAAPSATRTDPRAPEEKRGEDHEHEGESQTHEHEEGEDHADAHDHGGLFGERTELIFALASGAVLAIGFALSYVSSVPAGMSLALYVAAYIFGGYYTVLDAYENLRAGRFEVDFLMLVAAVGAAILGKWAEGAFLLFLFSTGHALEHYAMERARKAIESLAELAPETARVRRDGTEQEVPVEELRRGDTVIVRTNDRIPADGIVTKGESEVNQAPVTGESVPVEKRPVDDPQQAAEQEDDLDAAHRVFAGTINGSGALEVRVTRRSDETTLARVVQMVTEAEAEQSPTQRFTDRFERVFVPAVLGLVALLLFAWVPLDETFADSFYRAMAVLVAASPCALAIATPSAVLSGVARAGRGGVLVKGGGPLENLGTLTALAFDKTGTLTEGEPRVTDVQPYDGTMEDELLATAVAVEQLSDHPLAEAVVRFGRERLDGLKLDAAHDLESITGRGVKAVMGGLPVYIGKDDLFDEIDGTPLPDAVRQSVEELETSGRTTMIVRKGEHYLGVLGLMDTPREGAAKVIERLRQIGIRRMVMISGDNQRVAEAVGRELGIDEACGDLLPDDKVETIRALSQEEKVAMVGDGVNDAPAMANATVGIAMGAAGSDVALETADVALMADKLEHLPFAVGLSRQTSRIIRQNLWMALGMVAFLIPATILGLNIGPAVVLHEGSTLVVVANALRLLGYNES
jgi:Cd2+/Zn2+-exporting ATPase